MKYLDERITCSVTFPSPMPAKGVYTFNIYEYDIQAQNDDDELIFTGSYYFDRNGRTKSIDITDIVRSRKYTNNITYHTSVGGTGDCYLVKSFRVRVFLSGSNVTSNWEDVAMCYRYPTLSSATNPGYVFNTGGDNGLPRPALQGYTSINSLTLVPHYPVKNTTNYHFSQAFVHGTTISEIVLNYYVPGTGVDDYYTFNTGYDGRSTDLSVRLSNFIDWYHYGTTILNSGKDVTIANMVDTTGNDDTEFRKIAIMDICPKRYYLMWEDRFGGIQSQGFSDRASFSEKFDTTETQDYTNRRKKSFIQVQPKWKISSGWIKEELFPYYESIYVSPFLILYDTQEDRNYDVIVNSDYTEKTYKDEKKLLNITLELEQTTKQQIIY